MAKMSEPDSRQIRSLRLDLFMIFVYNMYGLLSLKGLSDCAIMRNIENLSCNYGMHISNADNIFKMKYLLFFWHCIVW